MKKKVCVTVYENAKYKGVNFLKFQSSYYPFTTDGPDSPELKDIARSLARHRNYTQADERAIGELTYTGKKFYFNRERS